MNGRIKRPEAPTRLVLPRVGQIKIGKKSERGFPMSVDYFIPAGKYASLFTAAYGEKPQTIQIVFPSDVTVGFLAEAISFGIYLQLA